MRSVEIRRATRDDAPALAQTHVESWQAAYSGILTPDVMESRNLEFRLDEWSEQFERNDQDERAYVADFDGEVGGFAFTQPCHDDDVKPEDVAELTALYLRPAFFGRGAGTALVGAALQDLRDAGFSEVILWVLEENVAARRFYERTGWAWDGTRAPCYRVFSAPALRYRRRL
jgi:GNAT superfamily N-acetyltransferase